jgi:hypothetical protein
VRHKVGSFDCPGRYLASWNLPLVHHGLVAAFTGGYGVRGRILSEDRMMR